MSYPAQTVDDTYHACHPELPLEPGDPRYVPLTPVRGGFDLSIVVAQCIQRTRPPTFHRQLVTGHRGSGKSTELKHLQARLRDARYFAVYLDVETVLDLGDITYLDVLVAIARALDDAVRAEKIRLSHKLLEDLDRWFAETVLTEEQRRDVTGSLKAEFGVGPKVPLLSRMLVAITGQFQSGSSRRVEIRRTLERELSVFLQRLNDLINDARTRLARKGWKDLVVIVDGLEKMHYAVLPDGQSTHSAFFVAHAEQLKSPCCHIVYTVPISLVFNVNLGDAFPDPAVVIPMVKLTEKDGLTPYEEGRQALFEMIRRRVEVETVFEDPDTVWQLIEASGGSVRDLMRLVRLACYGATERITPAHVKQAIRSLILEYDRLLKEDYLDRLRQVAKQRYLPQDELSAQLLHHRLVLEYVNDERWANLHPAVRRSPRLRRIVRR
ncbi:MAG: ATP-binding protein [Chloroflexi bacterium]|nr:MAG: ATP-binding protein [Chloroflexota bacterium]